MRSQLVRLLIILVSLTLSFTLETSAYSLNKQSALIIDTDADVDDIIALFYLLHEKQIDIKAITIETNGASPSCESALKNIAGMIALTKHQPIPLACGSPIPLSDDNHHFPKIIRNDAENLLSLANKLPQQKVIANETSTQLLTRVLKHTSQSVDVLAIGPLTNLGTLLQQAPPLKKKIHRIYVMGGAINTPGNLWIDPHIKNNNLAEWNIYIDPLAAAIVFKSGIPVFLIPLDLTNQAPMDKDFFNQLRILKNSPANTTAYFFSTWLLQNEKQMLEQKWDFWDPLAAVIAIHPNIVTFKRDKVSVLLSPETQSGTTIIDEKEGSPIYIGQAVDKRKFENLFLKPISQQ